MDDVLEVLNLILVGAKHSGKTVYLSTLFGADRSIAANSKETEEYLTHKWNDLQEGKIPAPTPTGFIYLDFAYETEVYNVKFRINDYGGQLAESISVQGKDTQRQRDELKRAIEGAEGVLFFFPYEKKLDKDAAENFKYEVDTFIDLMREIYPDLAGISIPVAIVVTKWDESSHCGRSKEEEKALQYIRSTEPYRAAKDKLTECFREVKVFPVSSFGVSGHGGHPSEGGIEPYNITSTLNFFLEEFFAVVAKRCDAFKRIGNLSVLFKFLHQRFDHIKSYNDGEYQKLLEEVEQQYGDKLLSELDQASCVKETNDIVKNNSYFIENVENEEMKRAFADKLLKAKLQKKRKLFTSVVILIFGLVGLGYAVGIYLVSHGEKNLIRRIERSTDSTPKEILAMTRKYLSSYRSGTLLIPYNIDDRRKIVEGIDAQAKRDIEAWLWDRFHYMEGLQPNAENLQKVRILLDDARLYPEFKGTSKIEDFSKKFARRFALIQKKNQKRQKNMARARVLMESAESDEQSLKDVLRGLSTLEGDDETCDMIERLTKKLRSIEARKKKETRINALTKARTLCESSKPDEDDIKKTLMILKKLGGDGQTRKLTKRLTRKLHSVQGQNAFIKIKNLLEHLNADAGATKIDSLVTKSWNGYFTREHRDTLKRIVDEKLSDKDRRDIGSLAGKYETLAQIKKHKDIVRRIKENEITIHRLDKYHYVRPPELSQRFEKVMAALSACEDALRGIKVRVEFIAQRLDNEPLGFRCEGWAKEKDIILRLDDKEFHYKHDNSNCSSDTKGRQGMKWQKPLTIKQKKYRVVAQEWDPFGSEHVEGDVLVLESMIFKIFNQGFAVLPISGTEYVLRFSKY